MKKVLASLLTVYALTNGQAPPIDVPAGIPENPPAPILPVNPDPAPANPEIPAVDPPVVEPPANPDPVPPVELPPPANPDPVAATPAPVTPAPVTPAPVTPAPVTPNPTTAPPTTAAPTLNQLCPLNAGEQSGIQPLQFNENRVCFTPNEVATDYLGTLRCQKFSCCHCAQINCGFNGYPCETLQIGDSGAVGVQSINVRGAPELNNPLQNIFGGNSQGGQASVECQGKESCRASIIRAEMIFEAQCSGDAGCQDAKIVVNDPLPGFIFQANGLASAQRADVEINVGVQENIQRGGAPCNPASAGGIYELGKIEFNGQMAGANVVVTIRNQGCGTVLFDSFECMSLDSCPGITVNIEGKVAVTNCDLMGVGAGSPGIQSLIAACTAGQNFNNFSPGNVIPVMPINPINPNPLPPVINPNPLPPVIQPNPNPLPPVINPIPGNPINPVVNPGFGGVGMIDPNSASLKCDQVQPMLGVGVPNPRSCANKAITIQISNNFVLDCSIAGGCDFMTLTLNAGYDPHNPMVPVTRIDSLKFVQPTRGATVYINNEFGAMGQPLLINDVRCEGTNRCRDLKVIAGPGVDIMSVNWDCNEITACVCATITQGAMTMPMDPRVGLCVNGQPQMQMGFGQQQQPGIPANPGQPVPFNPWV